MAARRASASSKAAAPSASPPLWNALVLAAAVCYALGLLVSRGKLSWPPTQLLMGAYTLAGCLALVGPIVLARRESGEGGVGELAWMAGGLLVWAHDLAALARGEWRSLNWATPLDSQPMGLAALAVLVAGWKCSGSGGRGWAWTNVVGWLLGAFWVGMAAWSIAAPSRPFGSRMPWSP